MRIRKLAIQTGQKYGRLLVLAGGATKSQIHCECECGNESYVRGDMLRSGNTRSCGCLHAEVNQTRNLTHGMSSKGQVDPLYHIWAAIKSRCNNPNNKRFERYGGRGIDMQVDWWNDAGLFAKYVSSLQGFADRERLNMTLDRVNNDLGYVEGNLRWATALVQRLNQERMG